MKTTPHTVLFTSLKLSAVLVGGMFLGACYWHHPHEDRTVIVDEHGWHHEGYYDEHHAWHGGYYDEAHVFHNDPDDWRH